MKTRLVIFASALFFLSCFIRADFLYSQNIGINITGTMPNSSAMLDVDVSGFAANNKKGLLIPRITAAQRDAIPSPVAGLLIYNITTNQINFYNSANWQTINDALSSSIIAGGTGTGGNVAINITGTAPDPSALLDIQSATQGLLPPRTTISSITSPVPGLLFYSTTTNRINFYDGITWQLPCDESVSTAAGGSQTSSGIAINSNGTAPNQSAILDISASTTGLLLPRITASERDALPSPAQGLVIYNSTSNRMEFFNGTQWRRLIYNLPTGVSASAGPNPICAGSTLTLTGGASDALNWSWTGPNGYTASLQNPTLANITTAGAGVYSLTTSNSCGSATTVNTASITVNGVPAQPSAITPGTGTTVCSGAGQTYAVSNISGTTYTWTYSGAGWSQTSGGTSNSITASATGSGTITVTPSNNCGNGPAQTLSITINTTPPTPVISWDGGASVPQYQSGSYNLSSNTTSGTDTWSCDKTWYWWGVCTTGPTTVSFGSTINACIKVAGTAVVSLTNAVGGCSSTGTYNLTISAGGSQGGPCSCLW